MIPTHVERPKSAPLIIRVWQQKLEIWGAMLKRFCKEVLALCFYQVLSCRVYTAWIRHSIVSQLCIREACGSGVQPLACMMACIKSQQTGQSALTFRFTAAIMRLIAFV